MSTTTTFPKLPLGIALSLLLIPAMAWSSDLDDGIPLDTPIDDSLKTGLNDSFILMKAKGKELSGNRKTLITNESNSAGQGNIILGPGTKLAPGTIILNNSDNRGATAVAR
ncbi:MAG: hypothetical protein ACPW60_01325 [Methylohalobius sp. ZOD2]|nr:hypothetical protein [Methylothermaceae bacterium]